MHEYVARNAERALGKALKRSPAAAILGPRQSGKSTLARHFLANTDAVYLDLQDRGDRNRLNEPELFFDHHRERLICLDEIQLLPEFFSVLRSEIDRDRRPGRFLILGSASRDLIRQTNESLAGRIAFLDLMPFVWTEVKETKTWQSLWFRGGFPDSLLAGDDEDSYDWRNDFIRTYLERDIPSLGLTIPMPVMERLWHLVAHYHGQTLNFSKLAEAADLSVPTLKKYLAVLEQTYMVRLVRPCEINVKKRWIKAPKIYLRDSGLLHALIDIESYDQLLGHPVKGASWEGFAMENVIASMPRHRPGFARTSNGAEIDLCMQRGSDLEVFEFKLSAAPRPSRGFYELIEELRPSKATIIAPIDEPYEYSKGVMVSGISG